ncbi:MAG: FAD:protein FMN transferase [Dehalococcoidales bacterium]|nr:MAG: FAD:protein FMN transferase [Dehalococcoidales bacterium]
MKKYFATILSFLLLLIVVLTPASCTEEKLERFEDTRSLMDTFVTVVIYSNQDTALETIDSAFVRMEEIETIATTWDSKGEAYRLNETGHLDNPSEELLELIKLSLEYNDITDGCFDITVQPLLDLWQYNPDAETQFWELDKSDQLLAIDDAMSLVGSDRIVLNGDSIRLEEGSSITLGGIAKGYAADEALKTLKSLGIKHALVNAGGDIRTLGTKPGGEGWGIALVNPDDTTQSLASFVVKGQAVTTSGNYERYFNPEKSAHHIIDPKTGFSADACISVTIIAEDGVRADALATGVFVLGPHEGMDLVEKLDDVEVLIVDTSRGIYRSSGLSKYLVEE